MASKLDLHDIKDFINLTFCCQQATVITDFSDLERVGRDHRMNINGGSIPVDEYAKLDGRMEAMKLIQNEQGTITPYGVVYDNGMKLEPLYDGRHFPPYLYKPPVMALETASGEDTQALRRLGADDELLDTIDGYTDFDQLGRAMMEEDGVRQTGYGLVRRLSKPFPPEQEVGMQMQ